MRRPADGTIVLALGAAVAILIGPLVLRGDQAEWARLAENRSRIAGMTASERARLERNYQQYLKLTPAERSRWRQFSERLALDRQRNQGRLTAAMNDYYRWLQTAPAYRREELRQAKNIDEKLAVVEEAVDDQLAARLESPEVETRVLPEGFRVNVLSSAALDEVIAAIQEFLSPGQVFPTDDDGQPPGTFERALQVVRTLQDRYKTLPPLIGTARFMTAVRDAMPEGVLSDADDIQSLRTRLQIISTLFFSLQEELLRELRRQNPSESELQAFFEEDLTPDQQEEFYNLSANEFVERVRRQYMEARLSERLGFDVGEVLNFFNPRPILLQLRERIADERSAGAAERDGDRDRLRPDRGDVLRPLQRNDRRIEEAPPREEKPRQPPPARRPGDF